MVINPLVDEVEALLALSCHKRTPGRTPALSPVGVPDVGFVWRRSEITP